jgi:Domain of unknown function (DUF5753)
VQVYAPVIVPELLRTEAYARAALSADPAVPEGDEEALVQAMLARQQAVLHDRKLPVTVVLGEAALRNQVGTGAVHSLQLARLSEPVASTLARSGTRRRMPGSGRPLP